MYKILVIDDEETIRRGLKVMIERARIKYAEILEAADGRTGFEMIGKYRPDIVITDIRMPYVDGLELIDKVHKNYSKRPIFIIISGYDDFNYAKRAIKYGVKEYLLKPIVKEDFIQLMNNITQELDDNVERHAAELVKNIQSKLGVELLQEKYFNSLITGTYYEENTVLKQLLQLGVDFSSDQFKVLVMEYRPRDPETGKKFDEMDRFALKEAADEGIAGVLKQVWTFYDADLRFVILFCNPENFFFEANLKKICEQLTRTFNKHLPVHTFFGVGASVSSLANIQKSYHDALYWTLFKIFREPESIVFGKDPAAEEKYLPNPLNFLKLTSEIELGMKRTVALLIDEHFQLFEYHKRPLARLIGFYDEFNRYMYHYFTEKGIDFSIVFEPGEEDFHELDSFWSLEELKDYLKGYLGKIADIIYTYKSSGPDRKIIEHVIRYMRENYDKDINLNIIAAHFGKNNSYLSVLFKKETGQNFVDYLTMIRMEKAKELLNQNKLKIQDIAAKVGYPNAKHFCMVFKKIVGVSPTQYRENAFS